MSKSTFIHTLYPGGITREPVMRRLLMLLLLLLLSVLHVRACVRACVIMRSAGSVRCSGGSQCAEKTAGHVGSNG
jgi:hypothetical protein